MTMLVNRWFKSGIGAAVGVASVGSGVAGFVVPVAAASIIEAHSLAAAFAYEGALSLVLAAVVFLLLRNRPADLGLKPGRFGCTGAQPCGARIQEEVAWLHLPQVHKVMGLPV